MSVLDSDKDVPRNMENYIKDKAIEELTWASLLIPNVSEVETEINPLWKKISQTWDVDKGSTKFSSDIVAILKKENSPFNPMLRPHLGRPVYTLDCRYLHKGDAIGWLEKVSHLPNSPMPILVIEHITEIPEEDANHDNPQYVQNLLMHSWKNPMNEFFNANTRTSFKIVPDDYKIFITWTTDKREKMDTIHQLSDGFAWIGDFEKYKEEFLAPYRASSIEELENKRIISYGQ